MRIVIVCYSFSDGFAYMEQKLARAFSEMGHETFVVCSTANRIDSKTVIKTKPSTYSLDGYTVIRLPFLTGGHVPNHKMPIILKGVYKKLKEIKPDLIYHMSVSFNLLDVKKYAKKYGCKLFVDNHASIDNSANNFVSLKVLHKFLYRKVAKSSMPYVDTFFYVGFFFLLLKI